MLRTRIKICGISTPETAVAVAEAGADAIGLVFVERSPRFVSVTQARKVLSVLPPFVEPVGLFADTPTSEVIAVAEALGLRTAQLHGKEDPSYAGELRDAFRGRLIKALHFEPSHAGERLNPWITDPSIIDGLLWDAPPTASAGLTGGSGQRFDWSALATAQGNDAVCSRLPVILAGGLTPQNVSDAITTIRPFAVDVSSGVESERGVKDPAKIKAFCDAVREADASLDHETGGFA